MKYKIYTIDKITKSVDDFYQKNNRYPQSNDFNGKDLPTARTIQREYGGLKELRRQLRLPVINYNAGEIRSEVARKINEQAYYSQNMVQNLLIGIFGENNVRRQPLFEEFHLRGPVGNKRADYWVKVKGKNIIIDVFHPKDIQSFSTSLNQKVKNYHDVADRNTDVYFVSTAPHISQEMIGNMVKNKKYPLEKGQQVVTFDVFKGKMDLIDIYNF